jgi:hypothetical protein
LKISFICLASVIAQNLSGFPAPGKTLRHCGELYLDNRQLRSVSEFGCNAPLIVRFHGLASPAWPVAADALPAMRRLEDYLAWSPKIIWIE